MGFIDEHLLSNTNEGIRNPITAFNFVLEVEGVFFLPLKSVRAFTKENEYEYIREGGVNDYVHMKRKPISKPFTFQIERYVGTERFLDPLANGTELALPLILHVYRHAAMQGFSALPDAAPARLYTFTGCTVISKEYGELNSERSSILTEVTTIAYRELLVITNPFQSTSEKEPYSIKNDKTKNKYAAKPELDHLRAEQEGPWDGGNNKDKTFAKQATNDKDGKKPVQKGPWDGAENKDKRSAAQATNDKNNIKPVQRGPWDGDANKDKKSARQAPKDSDRAPQVIWPPTRRALMAEKLSKNLKTTEEEET